MSYDPWPTSGCTIAEARERTFRRHALQASSSLSPEENSDDHDDTDTSFLKFLREGALIARSRTNDTGPAELVDAEFWQGDVVLDWANSCASRKHNCLQFKNISVLPALMGESAPHVLSGRRLSVVFKDFVLNDPEALAYCDGKGWETKSARPKKPVPKGLTFAAEYELSQDWDFDWHLPTDLEVYPTFQSVFYRPGTYWEKPRFSARHADTNCAVLWHRWSWLLTMLKTGTLITIGTHHFSGLRRCIDPDEWRRHTVWVDVRNGDLLESDGVSEEVFWTALRVATDTEIERPRKKRKKGSPKRDKVAAALEAAGLATRPRDMTIKQVVGHIMPLLAEAPQTAEEIEALTTMIRRIYDGN